MRPTPHPRRPPALARHLAPYAAVAQLCVGRGARAQDGATLPPPPPTEIDFLQYGAALTADTRISAGGVCPQGAHAPCIVGSGGGLALRAGYRTAEGWMFSGAYQFSKLDSENLLKLGILQQGRFEVRRYVIASGRRVGPYVFAGAGVALYGSEWSVDTLGPMAEAGIGVEYEISRGVVIGFSPNYRVVRLDAWHDDAGQYRPGGEVQFFGLDFTLEARSSLPRY